MSGMLSDEQLATLKSAKGEEFDRLFLEGMIGHHEGAISMVDIVDGSKNPEVQTLAANIVSSQGSEIKTMKEILTRLP